MATAPAEAGRPFYDAGPDIRRVLVAPAGRLGRLDQFVDKLLHLIPTAGADLVVELTPREARLLQELSSHATLEEIAASFYVSVNTIKPICANSTSPPDETPSPPPDNEA